LSIRSYISLFFSHKAIAGKFAQGLDFLKH